MKIKTRTVLCGILLSSLSQAQEAAPASGPQIKFNGDFRFRTEHVEKQGARVSVYEQQRIRARLGLTAKTDESTQLEFRFATAAGRTSTNQTLGNSSSSAASTQAMANYSFLLDRANIDLAASDALHFKAGRFGNPFYQPGDSDMIWDSDLNFDGLALKFQDKGESWTPFFNTGFFWVNKDLFNNRKDVVLGAAQVGIQNNVSDDTKWSFETAFYGYSGIRGHQGIASLTSTDGNTYEAGTNRIYDKSFKLVDVGVDFTTPVAGKALTLFNHYVSNVRSKPTPGVIAGFKWGALKDAGDWSFLYDYRRVPENSTVGAFTDGDSFGGGTNGWSHRVSAGYQVKKSWGTALSYLHGKSNIAKDNVKENRRLVQLDLNAKF